MVLLTNLDMQTMKSLTLCTHFRQWECIGLKQGISISVSAKRAIGSYTLFQSQIHAWKWVYISNELCASSFLWLCICAWSSRIPCLSSCYPIIYAIGASARSTGSKPSISLLYSASVASSSALDGGCMGPSKHVESRKILG